MLIGSSYIFGRGAASRRGISALYDSIWITPSSSTGEYGLGPERGDHTLARVRPTRALSWPSWASYGAMPSNFLVNGSSAVRGTTRM